MTKIDAIAQFCRVSRNFHVRLMSGYADSLSEKRMTDDQMVAKFRSRVRSDLKRAIGTLRSMDDDDRFLARAIDDVDALRSIDDFITRIVRQGDYAINNR